MTPNGDVLVKELNFEVLSYLWKMLLLFSWREQRFAVLKMYPAIVFEAFDIVLTSLSYTQSDLAVANRGVVYFRVRSPRYPPVLDILLPVAWASDGRDQRHIVSHPKDAGNVG